MPQDHQIVIYTAPGNDRCRRALRTIERHGLPCTVIAADRDPDFHRQLRSLGREEVLPQVVVDGTPVGGLEALWRLDRLGILRALADGDAVPVVRVRRRGHLVGRRTWEAERYGLDGARLAHAFGETEHAARAALDASRRARDSGPGGHRASPEP